MVEKTNMPELNVSVTLGDSRYLRQVMYAPEMFIHQLPAELFECDRFDDPVFCCTVAKFKEVLSSMTFKHLGSEEVTRLTMAEIKDLPDNAEVTISLWD